MREKIAALDGDIEHLSALVQDLERERKREEDILVSHAQAVEPNIQVLERSLSCVIEGLPNDCLLVRFWNIERANPSREFTFVLDPNSEQYKGQ